MARTSAPESRPRRPLAVSTALAALAIWLALAAAPAAGVQPNLRAQQWGLSQIDAPGAWSRTTGSGVVIGVVDTGVDTTQPALAGAVDATANCVGGTCVAGPAPDHVGHGTSVSGVAAGRRDGTEGFAGVAPDARLIVAKALDDKGIGDVEDISNAIRWVVDHGARIVNLSLGDDNFVLVSRDGSDLQPAIEYAWTHGAIPVLASGNYNAALGDNLSANYGNLDAVVVGATDPTGKTSWFSSPLGNAKWGVLAPGGAADHDPAHDVLVPLPGRDFKPEAGTSFAAPHVSGVLALLLAEGLSPEDAIHRLTTTADHGRVQAAAAVAIPAPASPAPSALLPRPSPRDASRPLVGIAFAVALAAAAAVGVVVRRERSG